MICNRRPFFAEKRVVMTKWREEGICEENDFLAGLTLENILQSQVFPFISQEWQGSHTSSLDSLSIKSQ